MKISTSYDPAERQEALADAFHFLEENNLLSALEAFLKSEAAKRVIKTHNDTLLQKVESLKSNAPKELSEKAENLISDMASYEVFEEIILLNFKIALKRSIVLMMDSLVLSEEHKKFILDFSKDALVNGEILEDLESLCKEVAQIIAQDYLEELYWDYVPEGFPPEIAAFLRAIGGGAPIIPITAIWPDFAESFSKDDDDDCDANKDIFDESNGNVDDSDKDTCNGDDGNGDSKNCANVTSK